MTLTDDGEGAQHFVVVLDAVGVVVVDGLQTLGTKPTLVNRQSSDPNQEKYILETVTPSFFFTSQAELMT